MSYCRFSEESDVYAYKCISGGWQIHLKGGDGMHCKTAEEFRDALVSLIDKGLRVQKYAIKRINDEIGAPNPAS